MNQMTLIVLAFALSAFAMFLFLLSGALLALVPHMFRFLVTNTRYVATKTRYEELMVKESEFLGDDDDDNGGGDDDDDNGGGDDDDDNGGGGDDPDPESDAPITFSGLIDYVKELNQHMATIFGVSANLFDYAKQTDTKQTDPEREDEKALLDRLARFDDAATALNTSQSEWTWLDSEDMDHLIAGHSEAEHNAGERFWQDVNRVHNTSVSRAIAEDVFEHGVDAGNAVDHGCGDYFSKERLN